MPAVQRAQEPVATECGRGEHEQLVSVPEKVSVPQAPPRRRRHPRQSVHGHDSQDLQWVLHVSERASKREPSSVPPPPPPPHLPLTFAFRVPTEMTVKESDFLRVFADNTYKLQLQKCCDEFSGRTVRPTRVMPQNLTASIRFSRSFCLSTPERKIARCHIDDI